MADVEKMEGFEEISLEDNGEDINEKKISDDNIKSDLNSPKENNETFNEERRANQPDFRVVQTDRDIDGRTIYKTVGAMWKQVSKQGNEFYVLKIGELRLLVFPNNRR